MASTRDINEVSLNPEDVQITEDFLRFGEWEFGRVGQAKPYSSSFCFGKDNKVIGYKNDNEAAWAIKEGAVELIRTDGRVSCRMDKVEVVREDSHSFLVISGRFNQQILHYLKRKIPTVGCFMRTHLWNADAERALTQLKQAFSGDIYVLYDSTHSTCPPVDSKVISHDLDFFKSMGLPCYQGLRTLWYCSDYPLYHLAMTSGYDYIVMSEFDTQVNCNIDDLVKRLCLAGAHFAGKETFSQAWMWTKVQQNWDAFEEKMKGEQKPKPISGIFFPFVIITRRAAVELLRRRLEIAEYYRKGDCDDLSIYPYCESFVPSEVLRSGYKMADLRSYIDTSDLNLDVKHPAIYKPRNNSVSHPLLSGSAFVNKLFSRSTEQLKLNGEDAKHELLLSCSTEDEKQLMLSKIESFISEAQSS